MADDVVHISTSAHRHGVSNDDMLHALAMPIRTFNLDDGMVMVIGPSRTGALLEIGIVESHEGDVLIVHAMRARPKFLPAKG